MRGLRACNIHQALPDLSVLPASMAYCHVVHHGHPGPHNWADPTAVFLHCVQTVDPWLSLSLWQSVTAKHTIQPPSFGGSRALFLASDVCIVLLLSAVCRGKFRSKPWQSVLDEAKHLVDSGVVELNLIAEDTNQ